MNISPFPFLECLVLDIVVNRCEELIEKINKEVFFNKANHIGWWNHPLTLYLKLEIFFWFYTFYFLQVHYFFLFPIKYMIYGPNIFLNFTTRLNPLFFLCSIIPMLRVLIVSHATIQINALNIFCLVSLSAIFNFGWCKHSKCHVLFFLHK